LSTLQHHVDKNPSVGSRKDEYGGGTTESCGWVAEPVLEQNSLVEIYIIPYFHKPGLLCSGSGF